MCDLKQNKTQEPSCLGKLLSRFKDIKHYICDLFWMVIGKLEEQLQVSI